MNLPFLKPRPNALAQIRADVDALSRIFEATESDVSLAIDLIESGLTQQGFDVLLMAQSRMVGTNSAGIVRHFRQAGLQIVRRAS